MPLTPGSASLKSDNKLVISRDMSVKKDPRLRGLVSFEQLLAEEQLADPVFRAEWQRLAPARELATAILRYRADNGLSQRDLARELDVSQPRVHKLESGEHNPSIETLISVVQRLGIDFALDISPTDRPSSFVTARARRQNAVEHDGVTVVVASSH
jgi:DNA-binding XRE family transcriptional regulator